ncbi:hypothetical protein FRC08_014580 [Ceratobasidium sp. 394]|nr:hypothetical protein FRC08_014580 [Ceratobasidium sp. 394]
MAEDAGTDEADYSGYENENENDPEEVAWDYSGEDASEDEEQSAAGEAEEEGAEEEEDTFIGKGKGRHPAEGPGLAGLLNGSGAQRTGRTAQTPERAGRSSRALEDSFEEGVGRMPILGPTSTPFISRLRSGSPHSPDGSEDDEESPPWEVGQGLSVPEIAENPGNESEEYESEEESADEKNGPGAAREDAIEVLDSDEEAEAIKAPNEEQVDEIAPSPARSNGSDRPHVVVSHQEFDELQFDDSAAYLDEHEPDSLLDDTMDEDDSVRLQVLAGHLFPPRPSSLFSASSAAATREPSQSKDAEELDQSAETVQAPEYSVEEPDTSTLPADREPEPDQPSIQQSMDYSDFIGENSLLAQQDTSLTQAEQHFQEVTVYELENGSRYYDYDGVRHFLNSEGEVYETIAIPPPRPTIQQPPELSMIEEVTEYDITRRLGGADDDNGDGGAKFDFLKEFDDTFSSVGEPILHYPGEDNSVAFGIDDIPERPGAALGFRSRDLPGADASAFLSDSAILRDDLGEYDTGEHHGVLGQLGATTSMTGTVESMGGRNSGDLISDDGLITPELSIATSISGRSGVVPNVSVYEGSPTSSPHPEDPIPAIPPAEPDTTQLPDPNLPPSPTHLSMPAVPTAPGASEARREVSPSVVVEPPTPHARSEDGTVGADPTIKPPEEETHAPTDESETNEGSRPVVVKDAEVDEEVDVVGPLSQGANTPSRRSRTRSPSARSSTKESSGSRTTPTPGEKIRAGDKRKRLEDPPSPASTPLKLSLKSPARSNGPVKSPLSDANPSPNTPTPRGNRSLFKRTPNSKPASTASGSSSRKVSGSDTAPAPWPMRHRTHRHTSATVTSPERLRANTSRGSPAPRSNCRFHKVTIPADDKSAGKIEFIIPACALGRPKVLEEHGAEDCGLLAPEEEGSMVTDLGDIEPGAIDKLKAIVGTTLFDENVCGYLPKSPATTSHPAPNRLKGSLRGSISSLKFEPTSEGESKAAPIQAKPKPRSRPSILHDDQPYKPPAEDNDSDDPTEEERTRKRPKLKKRETTGPTSTVKFPSLGQDSPEKPAHPIGPGEARIPISRRMKRARRPADAQPYKPEPDQGESSPDDDVKSKPRKRIKHRAASATRRTNSGTTLQESKRQEDEDENPFKPKHELKRVLSPEAINGGTQGQSTSSVLDSKPTRAEQKELEQHIELGDHPGEVVDEEGSPVNVEQLSEPAPAKVAAYVDRGAPSEIGKKEANGAGENALGAIGASKKGWSKYLRF